MRYRLKPQSYYATLPFDIDQYATFPANCSITCTQKVNPLCHPRGCC